MTNKYANKGSVKTDKSKGKSGEKQDNDRDRGVKNAIMKNSLSQAINPITATRKIKGISEK